MMQNTKCKEKISYRKGADKMNIYLQEKKMRNIY